MWLGAVGDTLVNAARVHLDILRQDLRHTSRTLRRTPGFTITAILVTALGVGATTAAFTLADHVLLRPLPFRRAGSVGQDLGGPDGRAAILQHEPSPPNYLDWKGLSSSFSVMGAYACVTSNLVGGGEPERLEVRRPPAASFRMLGRCARIGRVLERIGCHAAHHSRSC